MRTKLLKDLGERKRSKRSGFTLVPLIEEYMRKPVEIVDDRQTRTFFKVLISRRAEPRLSGIISPSLMGKCERQQYFRFIDEPKQKILNQRANGYFIDGEFRHWKWQFILFQMDRYHDQIWGEDEDVFELVGVEVPLTNKSGTIRGTCDAIVRVYDEFYVIDFKGANTFSWDTMEGNKLSFPDYNIQIATYGTLANHVYSDEFKISKCLIIAERKDGPKQGGSPIGLHERQILVEDYEEDIRRRVRSIRDHAKKEKRPPISCEKTSSSEFYGCPFNKWCRKEVEALG